MSTKRAMAPTTFPFDIPSRWADQHEIRHVTWLTDVPKGWSMSAPTRFPIPVHWYTPGAMGTMKAKNKVVSQAKWVAAHKKFLAKEKAFTRARDALARQRRQLPWVEVTKEYVFDGPKGKLTLRNLFGAKNQLLVYHFMLGPGWKEGCFGCSFVSDHFDGALLHLPQRDVSFYAVSRAPLKEINAFKKRMNWHFPWVSSGKTDFNLDFWVSSNRAGKGLYNFVQTKWDANDERPGISAFVKGADGRIFHTYSSYARGLDLLVGAYNLLDLTPKGRDEDKLDWPMQWVKHHDRY